MVERHQSAPDRRAAVGGRPRLGSVELIEPELKRAPRGYPQDHPHVERLKLKSVVVHTRHDLAPWLHTPECDARVRAELEAAKPLVDWLKAHL